MRDDLSNQPGNLRDRGNFCSVHAISLDLALFFFSMRRITMEDLENDA